MLGVLLGSVQVQPCHLHGGLALGLGCQRWRAQAALGQEQLVLADRGDGVPAQARHVGQGQALGGLLAVTHGLHGLVQAGEVQPVGLQQGPGIAAAQQLILHVDAIVQEGLRDAAALRAVLVLHIPPAQRLHGGELDLLALQAAAGNGAVRVLCVALLGGAAAQQRPAHAHLALDAAVVAAQGVGDGLACLAQVGTAEKAGALACLRGGTALFGHGHFGLCQAGRRGVGACAVFQLGQ